jgi:hypothetical protein
MSRRELFKTILLGAAISVALTITYVLVALAAVKWAH